MSEYPKLVEAWMASDGKTFGSEKAAKAHQSKINLETRLSEFWQRHGRAEMSKADALVICLDNVNELTSILNEHP